MGLFDYVKSDYPLPGNPPTFVGTPPIEWSGLQTKDLDNPYLNTYTITADGRLVDEDGEDLHYHGDLEFGGSNWAGCDGKGQWYTRKGEDLERVEYRARFTDGRLTSLVQVERSREPAKAMSEWPR